MQRLVLSSSELASERASGQYGSVIDCLISLAVFGEIGSDNERIYPLCPSYCNCLV